MEYTGGGDNSCPLSLQASAFSGRSSRDVGRKKQRILSAGLNKTLFISTDIRRKGRDRRAGTNEINPMQNDDYYYQRKNIETVNLAGVLHIESGFASGHESHDSNSGEDSSR